MGRVVSPSSPIYAGDAHWICGAFRRYDPALRLRWSFEKEKWVLEAKAKDQRGLIPPVYWELVDQGSWQRERLLPELSDRRIGWNDGFYPVLYIARLSQLALDAFAASDVERFKSPKHYVKFIEEMERKEEEERERKADERATEYAKEVSGYAWAKCGNKIYMSNGVKQDSVNWW